MSLRNIGIEVSTHHWSVSGERRCAWSWGKRLNEVAKRGITKVDGG